MPVDRIRVHHSHVSGRRTTQRIPEAHWEKLQAQVERLNAELCRPADEGETGGQRGPGAAADGGEEQP